MKAETFKNFPGRGHGLLLYFRHISLGVAIRWLSWHVEEMGDGRKCYEFGPFVLVA